MSSTTNLLEKTFNNLRSQGRKAFIPYLCAGDPDLETTAALIEKMKNAGADVVELGIPFSDPMADGPVIQAASQRSLAAGTTVAKILDMVFRAKEKTGLPLVLMTYLNPVLRYGIGAFVAAAAKAGVDGLIVPDLSFEESGELADKCDEEDICLIPLVAPTTPAERLGMVVSRGRGFVYCVSLTGTTGTRESLSSGISGFITRVREATTLPLGLGFGISTPDHVRSVAPLVDGVIVGSALVRFLESGAGGIAGLESLAYEMANVLKR